MMSLRWKDYLLFYEYFHGDNGAGLGASHQTGWTGIIGKLIELFGRLDAQQLLAAGKGAVISSGKPPEDHHADVAGRFRIDSVPVDQRGETFRTRTAGSPDYDSKCD
jgi:hypothetical protein